VKHAAELKVANDFAVALNIVLNGSDGLKVIFFLSHIKELESTRNIRIEVSQSCDNAIEQLLFFAQCLCFLLIIPERWIFKDGIDFSKAA
jgi:hypothetical protein